MIGERENFDSETKYGSLIMRHYSIDGNEISAFYDSSDNLVFVLDNTVNSRKPNILLVINPDADKKWDEILSGDYDVDLETIRPKQDNKYQKFDIEYSGLPVYDALIKAFDAGDSLEESLNQLMILRDSAARHSAMTRLNMANEIIAKTNATIVKTKESIVRLQARLKTLRGKLSEAKKTIGREPTKQSASKILKLEAQIDATNEKLKRANERLKSAQRRLETATVDAELASELLNQPLGELKKNTKKQVPAVVSVKKNAVVKKKQEEPEYEEDIEQDKEDDDDFVEIDDDSDDVVTKEETEQMDENYNEENTEKVEPLFKEDPQILDDDIAFKPISFEAPVVPEISQSGNISDSSSDTIVTEEITETTEETKDESDSQEIKEQTPVLESMIPVPAEESDVPVPIFEPADIEKIENETQEIVEEKPIEEKTEIIKEEPLEVEAVKEDVRQFEPEVVEETVETTTEKTDNFDNKYVVMPPVPPVMPRSVSNVGVVEDVEPKRSKFFYYLLLILLIVLAVFTLWLYQYRIKPTAPVLAASVEKTELPKEQNTVFKKTNQNQKVKTSKQIKAPTTKKDKEIDLAPTFLDEEPVETTAEPTTEEIPTVVEENVETGVVERADSAPEIIDAVPAHVTTSGQADEDESASLSEEDVLASKPVYQPGSRYDEMFVADEGGEVISPVEVEYIEENTVYMPEDNTVEYVEEDKAQEVDPYFDEEEAAYQAEQAELYYEE